MNEFLKKYSPIVTIILLYFLVRSLTKGWVPDYATLESANPHELFSLIITTTASVIGIIIAVVLLTFDISKGGFLRSKEHNVLNNPVVRYIISLFSLIVILCIYSLIQVKNFDTVNSLTTGYYLIFLFLLFIVSLFPAIKNILETTNSLKRTLNEIRSIAIENVVEVLRVQFDNFSFNDNSKLLIRIRQQLIIYIREHDYEAYTNTLQSLNKKMLELVGNGADRRRTDSIIDATCFIWESANSEALRVQNIQYFNTVWECIEQLYEYAAVNKIQLMFLQPLDFYVSNYTSFLQRNRLNEPLFKGVEVLANAFKLNLKHNCPAQEMLNDLYREYENNDTMPHHIDSSIQWDNITGFILDIFSIQNSSIELNDGELYRKGNFELEHLFHEIVNTQFPNLGIYQEAYLIEDISRTRIENEAKALKQNAFEMALSSFESESSYLAAFAEKNKIYTQRIMTAFSDFIIKLQYEQILSSRTLNFWTAIGRHLSKNYTKNELCCKSFDYVFNTLLFLKSFIENNQLPSSQHIYLEIKSQMLSLKNWLNKDHPKKRFIIKSRINDALQGFMPATEQVNQDIVKWK